MTGPVWPDVLTVHVTAADIAQGRRGDCARCPIALATHRALGPLPGRSIWAGPGQLVIASDVCATAEAAWWTPRSARQFIAQFDNDMAVEPFTFTAERAA